mmetsp:Transcript_64677/g.187442  ORF Transcript_64677/g.187442 Transcript_64677/m.187442 type:complete len:216 (+) Transcript_64677:484-1131(+)
MPWIHVPNWPSCPSQAVVKRVSLTDTSSTKKGSAPLAQKRLQRWHLVEVNRWPSKMALRLCECMRVPLLPHCTMLYSYSRLCTCAFIRSWDPLLLSTTMSRCLTTWVMSVSRDSSRCSASWSRGLAFRGLDGPSPGNGTLPRESSKWLRNSWVSCCFCSAGSVCSNFRERSDAGNARWACKRKLCSAALHKKPVSSACCMPCISSATASGKFDAG